MGRGPPPPPRTDSGRSQARAALTTTSVRRVPSQTRLDGRLSGLAPLGCPVVDGVSEGHNTPPVLALGATGGVSISTGSPPSPALPPRRRPQARRPPLRHTYLPVVLDVPAPQGTGQ